MSSVQGGPFRFGELKGTRWYYRFVAEEFYLVFDQYPKKSIVIDRCIDRSVDRTEAGGPGKRAPKPAPEPALAEEYRRQLLNFFFQSSEIDTFTPARILHDLRQLRKTVLGECDPGPNFLSFDTAQAADGHKQMDQLNKGHRSIQSKIQSMYPGNMVLVMSGFTEALRGAKRILFIPGSPHRFAAELEILLQHSAAEIEIACTMDDTEAGVTAEQASEALSACSRGDREVCLTETLPFVLGKDDIHELAEKSMHQLICISNIWTYLQLFRSLGGFCFFLDNSEWFSRGLFQTAYDTDESAQAYPLRESSYQEILYPAEPESGHTVAAFQNHPFPFQVDVSGVQYNSLSLYKFLKGEPTEKLSARLQRQQKKLQDRGWHQVVNGYVLINGGRVQPSEGGAAGAVLVSSVAAQEKSVKLRPALLTRRASICPDAVSGGSLGAALYTSFNYYFTENLRSLYNQQVPSAQKIPYMDLLIDYIGMRQSGQWHETIPLYQKAMLGAGSDGELCAGYYPLEQASLTITALDGTWEQSLHFLSSQINPQDGGSGLYLPSYHELWVGGGFYCLALVQDQPVCHQPGPCRIPPLGSVVVLEEKLSFDKAFFRWNVFLDELPLPKENLEWLVGGFNLLVDKGVNLYQNPQQGLASLEREGWNGTQSSETQETQLDPFVPQPRSMLGKAVSGKVLLMSIAGRTRLSKGATFTEAVQIAQYLLGETDSFEFLINFDGGASASITASYQGECEALGLTAPSLSNPAGVARQLKSYLILEKNTQQESL